MPSGQDVKVAATAVARTQHRERWIRDRYACRGFAGAGFKRSAGAKLFHLKLSVCSESGHKKGQVPYITIRTLPGECCGTKASIVQHTCPFQPRHSNTEGMREPEDVFLAVDRYAIRKPGSASLPACTFAKAITTLWFYPALLTLKDIMPGVRIV